MGPAGASRPSTSWCKRASMILGLAGSTARHWLGCGTWQTTFGFTPT